MKNLEVLDLSNNKLIGFKGLKDLPKLKTLILEENQIEDDSEFPEGLNTLEEVRAKNSGSSKLDTLKARVPKTCKVLL